MSPKADPIEQEIERALQPGRFISDWHCSSFVDPLFHIAEKIGALVTADPARAVGLYEAFLAGCFAKAEELDDSSGGFGDLVQELFRDWLKARQALGADPEETVSRLLSWIDHDDYGFCHDLEAEAAKVLDKQGLAALEKKILTRLKEAFQAKPPTDGDHGPSPEYLRHRCSAALRAIYLARKNLKAYIAFAEEHGLTVKDCHEIAKILAGRKKHQEALSWVDRGIELDKTERGTGLSGAHLVELRRELLKKLGRGREAVEDAWAAFQEHPGTFSYDALMKLVPKADRAKWHKKAIGAGTRADIDSLMELLVETGEFAVLADLVARSSDKDLEEVSHFSSEPAAKKLEKSRPDLAARRWRAQGMRIVNKKQSKHYNAAIRCFESAMRCYKKAGLAKEWEKLARRILTTHSRKTSFIAKFKRLLEASNEPKKPSFLERAKARWVRKEGP